MKPIKQSVVNTFKRVGIDYKTLQESPDTIVTNRFTGEQCETSALVAFCVRWVYQISDFLEAGIQKVSISDFDRIRYFILDADQKVYMKCID